MIEHSVERTHAYKHQNLENVRIVSHCNAKSAHQANYQYYWKLCNTRDKVVSLYFVLRANHAVHERSASWCNSCGIYEHTCTCYTYTITLRAKVILNISHSGDTAQAQPELVWVKLYISIFRCIFCALIIFFTDSGMKHLYHILFYVVMAHTLH